MNTRLHRFLIASEIEGLVHLVESQVARDTYGGPVIRPHACLFDDLEETLREQEADGVLVTQERFHEGLPASVRRWKMLRPDVQVLFLFRHLPQTRELVELMRAGAFDVVEMESDQPSEQLVRDVLLSLVRRLDEVGRGEFERQHARQSVADLGLIGESLEMQNLFVQVLHAARLTCPVLISGPPGSGKRLIAHAIHALSARAAQPVITVDCASLSPQLLDSVLFGAASQARAAAPGVSRGSMLDAARRGTLILNEVGELPHNLQLDLFRLLESVEEEGPSGFDGRILSTISRRMESLVETKAFRADLCYRLNVLPLDVPSLRRRIQDVPLLARYFLSRNERDSRQFTLSEDAASALCRYDWPGNVLELRNAIEYAVGHSVDDVVVRSHLPDTVLSGRRAALPETASFSSNELNLDRLEEQAILRALQVSGFDKAKTARLLGIGKTTMYRKLKEMSARSRGE
jgi:DNA-binding NtrC family response regulator